MSIRQEYFDLLAHVGNTSTVATLVGSSEDENRVAMRHDVDHDLELALEMAHHEWRLGCKSTYYLLHTAPYWNDPKFPLLVRQLKEYGHEIGLHVNFLTQWMRGEIDDVELEIERALAHVRACGVEVTGVCAHGDKLCYEKGFVNYWLWKELCGVNPRPRKLRHTSGSSRGSSFFTAVRHLLRGRRYTPMESEDGISAEGIHVDDPAYQISYPKNHELVREDGATFPLWSISMEKHGLHYDAAKLQQEHYWSDSGGKWVRTGDPTQADCSIGRHQVLVHPWWWRGEPKKIFVMSPPRSGSKWLANYIDKATSAVGLHEWTLNHVREGDEFPLDNLTTREFVSLLGDAPEISSRLRAARAHHTLLKRDVVECNVYVEAVAEMLQINIPDAEIMHLSFKKMVSNKDYLKEELFKIGIVVHPWLVEEMNVSTIE